jgi:general secretion pathway protein I
MQLVMKYFNSSLITQNSKFNTQNCRVPSARGFTLLEVMMAMAILAVSLLAVFWSQSQSISMAQQSRTVTTMSLLAQSRMADLEVQEVLSTGTQTGDFGNDYVDYTWRTVVAPSDVQSLGRVEVIVTNIKMTTNNTYRLIFYRPMNRKTWQRGS